MSGNPVFSDNNNTAMKNRHFLPLRLMSALMVYKEELPTIGEMNRWDGCREKAWMALKIRNALIGR